MAQVQRGDQAALATLYDRYAPVVLGVLMRIVGDRTVAEEVLQEAFWRVWDKSGSFDVDKGSFKTWMFSIARRHAIDVVRRQKVRPQAMQSDSADLILELQTDEADVSAEVEQTLTASTLRSVLDNLSSEQREVIELAYFKGKTRREIAAITNVPLGTIHTRARLALQRLRKLLEAQGMEGVA